MDEAAPDEGPAAEKKRPLLRRIPTPLVVTLVGIALTAWLLPAFTRQWNDRQKAHELKAGVVADIASATAPALLGGEAVWSGRTRGAKQRQQLGDQWALAALEIEARLRSYLSDDVVADWQIYAWAIDHFVGANHPTTTQGLGAAELATVSHTVHIDPPVASSLLAVVQGRDHTHGRMPDFTDATLDQLMRDLHEQIHSRGFLKTTAVARERGRPTWQQMEYALILMERDVADQVISSHVSGYSTTYSDLINDLIP